MLSEFQLIHYIMPITCSIPIAFCQFPVFGGIQSCWKPLESCKIVYQSVRRSIGLLLLHDFPEWLSPVLSTLVFVYRMAHFDDSFHHFLRFSDKQEHLDSKVVRKTVIVQFWADANQPTILVTVVQKSAIFKAIKAQPCAAFEHKCFFQAFQKRICLRKSIMILLEHMSISGCHLGLRDLIWYYAKYPNIKDRGSCHHMQS